MKTFALIVGTFISLAACVLVAGSNNPQQVGAAGLMVILGYVLVYWALREEYR